jgi:hypothetical protein
VALRAGGFRVDDLLRVADGRYWSYVCSNSACCDPRGTPCDSATGPVSTAALAAGAVAVPDRAALVASIAPIGGLTRVSMRQATDRARIQLAVETGVAVRDAGETAVREAIARRRAGGSLSDDEVARLTVLLAVHDVRDFAWREITEPELHVALWTEVVRRAEYVLVAPPASLLAFAAWRGGQGALASVAVDRALRADPSYALAGLVGSALSHGISPSMLDNWPDLPPVRRRTGRRTRRSKPDVDVRS